MGKYLKIGDIFAVYLGNGTKGYVQYIADDMTQLNSRVVRSFKNRYSVTDNPTVDVIVSGEIEFYAHVYDVKSVEKEGLWKKVGKSNDVGDIKKPIFRSTPEDITLSSPSHISKHWYVWKIGEDSKEVRPGNKILKQTDFGSVTPASDIAVRMRTGKTEFFHPKYEGEE
jgi:hypothetical protein